ncbi:RUN domain-containing protein 1 [Venturia canescens]|uniref:RUN domain-containing protein 1 n=1 Tax=Venturia canescens TaxID=32260 RepID=UPI001C9C3426|nr:RUN domain-containing protein 1 [Venturia canescens]XP_043285371.1 RUN domain-containing protein 1 [Venturia canescens]
MSQLYELISDSVVATPITKIQCSNFESHKVCEGDELYYSDESDRPSGERWAPVGANDGDNDSSDEHKCSNSMEILSCNVDRLKLLEEEQEILNSSLIALTTHFAQVQFRLRQIVDAPAGEKDALLRELEKFAFRGIPDVPSNIIQTSTLSTPASSVPHQQSIDVSLHDVEVESKMAFHRSKQRELIGQLKHQLQELEAYAYETGGQDLPQSLLLERQNIVINHLKEKLNFNVDDMCKLPEDDLRWQVDHAINQIVSPLKMKEQLVSQLKTQIIDLERFIDYLQGEVSSETLACSCSCPVHKTNLRPTSTTFSKAEIPETDEENHARTLHTVRKVVSLLHMFVMSQLGCGSSHVRRSFQKNSVYNWRDLRTRLDIAVEHVLEVVADTNCCDHSHNENERVYTSGSESTRVPSISAVTVAVRNHLTVCIRNLMQHGIVPDMKTTSILPFVGCFPLNRSSSSSSLHIWELIIKYYELKNGQRYNSSPAQKLSQSFNLKLVTDQNKSTKKMLLITIGNIVSSHTLYKRSYDSQFKAFVCAALNAKKLVIWLKMILQCQHILENYYASWSYVVKTGFQDAFNSLDRLTTCHFALPVDLAIRQFRNIKDAF